MRELQTKLRNSSPLQKVSVMMVATIVARLFGMLREVVLGGVLGTTAVADAYVVAFSVPCTLVAAFLTAISTTFVPGYIVENEKNGKRNALRFTNSFLSIVIIITMILSIIVVLFADPIISIAASGFDESTMELAILMCRYMALTIVLQGIAYVFIGYLHSNDEFTIPAIYTLPSNIILIISLLLYKKSGIEMLYYGVLVAYSAQVLVLLCTSVKYGYCYRPQMDYKRESIKKAVRESFPVMISMAFYEINTFIDKMLASTLPQGSVSALNYAGKLSEFLNIVFATLLATWIFPKLSESVAVNDENGLLNKLQKGLKINADIAVPAVVLCFVYATQGIRIIFERGAFSSAATITTAGVFRLYCIATIFNASREMISRAFYAEGNTKKPMYITILAICINIILNLCFVQMCGLNGIAIASVISSFISASIFTIIYYRAHRKFKLWFYGRRVVINLIYMFPGTLLSYMVYKKVVVSINTNMAKNILVLFAYGIIAIIPYIMLLLIEKRIIKTQ